MVYVNQYMLKKHCLQLVNTLQNLFAHTAHTCLLRPHTRALYLSPWFVNYKLSGALFPSISSYLHFMKCNLYKII